MNLLRITFLLNTSNVFDMLYSLFDILLIGGLHKFLTAVSGTGSMKLQGYTMKGGLTRHGNKGITYMCLTGPVKSNVFAVCFTALGQNAYNSN